MFRLHTPSLSTLLLTTLLTFGLTGCSEPDGDNTSNQNIDLGDAETDGELDDEGDQEPGGDQGDQEPGGDDEGDQEPGGDHEVDPGCQSNFECRDHEACFQGDCLPRCAQPEECLDTEACAPVNPEDLDGDQVCLPLPEEGCLFDADCADFEICVESICEATCQDALDCALGELCVQRPTGGSSYCIIDESIICEPECSPEQSCINNVCVDPPEYFTLRILDVTAPSRCDHSHYGYATAGVEVISLALYNRDDQLLAYGTATDFLNGDPAADFGDPLTLINGQAPTLDANHCPQETTFSHRDSGESLTSNYNAQGLAALGCAGELFVHFFGDAGHLQIEEDFKVEVIAYSQICNDTSTTPLDTDEVPFEESPYLVEVCTDAAATDIDTTTCDSLLPPATHTTGRRLLTIAP